jgi:hypothetical protein
MGEWRRRVDRQGRNSGTSRQAGASHILRRNTIRYCGVEGIGGMGTSNTLIEDNVIEWCGWADAERGWEAAGAKFHNARNLLFRRNVVRHMRHANAIWLDVGNANCRLTRNVFADVVSVSAAVHMEMTTDTNQIDNNVIWNVRNAEPGTPGQRGCAARDFRQCHRQADRRAEPDRPLRQLRPLCHHAARSQGKRHRDGQRHLEQHLREVRQVGDRVPDARQRGRWQRLCGHAARFQGYGEGDAKQYVDLETWRHAHGWDTNSWWPMRKSISTPDNAPARRWRRDGQRAAG